MLFPQQADKITACIRSYRGNVAFCQLLLYEGRSIERNRVYVYEAAKLRLKTKELLVTKRKQRR